MKLEICDQWDESFFEEYRDFRDLIFKNISSELPAKVSDYEKFFGDQSPFKLDFNWRALVVLRDKKRVAQGILTWKNASTVGHLGFLDFHDDPEASAFLFEQITVLAKENKLQKIKTPVDVNLFVKYRMKTFGDKQPFFGEPRYPDYYQNHFEKSHFSIIGEWDTYKIKVNEGIIDFFSKRKLLSKKSSEVHAFSIKKNLRTTIRSINMKKWDEELKIIYKLFTNAYKDMPEFEMISFEQFKIIYDDFKYLVQPWLSFIVELQGKPVGFSINFVDPLPILQKVKNKKLTSMDKIKLFIKMRLNRGTLLISHVGKIPGPNGEEIKGVQIQVSKRIAFFSLFMKRVLVTFQNQHSPSRRSWNGNVQIPYAKYVLYGKSI